MPDSSIRSETFHIPALCCPDELALIEKALGRLEGIKDLVPNYMQQALRVEFDSGLLDLATIKDLLGRAGFPVRDRKPAGDSEALDRDDPALRIRRVTTLVSGVLLADVVIARLDIGQMTRWLDMELVAIAATLIAGFPVARVAWRAVRLRSLDMNVLMTIAAIGALVTGNTLEAAMAMFLFGVSLWLESFSMGRARRAVHSLVELSPKVAHRVTQEEGRAEQTEDVDPAELAIDQKVLVKPGERIPIDGLVLSGDSAVNQAPITGESVPVERTRGDHVFAGTLNGEGSLTIQVTQRAAESTLAHIARLVEQAQASRSPTERFVDKFARRYTPIVIMLAVGIIVIPPLLVTWFDVEWAKTDTDRLWMEWLYRGLVLLVIACPCALVISTPVTIVCGLYAAARRGLLIKGGEHLENAGRVDCIALDKTGTLTTGQVEVLRIEPAAGYTEDDVLRIAAALESHSEHPLATAIVEASRRRNLQIESVEEFRALRGFGVQATLRDQTYYVGNPRLFREKQLGGPGFVHDESEVSATAALVGTQQQFLGTLWLADRPREDAREAIAQLKRLGVEPIVMLTGDSQAVAESVAEELGIDQVLAELLPEDKVARVQSLAAEYRHMAMVGDGVNDAPALAAAHLGIALGSMASDTALETADVVVMTPRLSRVCELVRLGRRCKAILVQNITFALAVKITFLVLAFLGLVGMALAVAADVGATMLVVFNGMRLLGWSGR